MDGTKHYEYRKAVPVKKVTHIVVYASSPKKKIVGIAEVEKVISGPVAQIWKKTSAYSGINKEAYFEYFAEKDVAYAFKLSEIKKLKSDVSPFDFWKDFSIPQSFRYLENKFFSQIDSLGYDYVRE